jgi:hypothetical protein
VARATSSAALDCAAPRPPVCHCGGARIETILHSEPAMRTLQALAITCLMLGASAGWAADQTCKAAAEEKKLAGAAKTSFLKKCEKDAAAACEMAAADKKLAGAAKTSSVKKCTKDAVGA